MNTRLVTKEVFCLILIKFFLDQLYFLFEGYFSILIIQEAILDQTKVRYRLSYLWQYKMARNFSQDAMTCIFRYCLLPILSNIDRILRQILLRLHLQIIIIFLKKERILQRILITYPCQNPTLGLITCM